MKKRTTLLLVSILTYFSLIALPVTGQTLVKKPILDENGNETGIFNVNPDSNGDPWIIAPLQMTPEIQAKLDNIPEWEPDKSKALPVPPSVNHFREKEFRPIFRQQHSNCSAASGIGYDYTWEVNILTGADGSKPENQCANGYCYNFINGGSSVGVWYYDCWDILKETGCVRATDWPSEWSCTYWADEYEAYHRGNFDRCVNYYKIDDPGSPEGLQKLKQWMYDHGKGDEKGGCVTFNANVSFGIQSIPEGSAEAGSKITTTFNGSSTAHAMVFAGYNDSVYYEENEKGAVLLVNSHGIGFGDSGIVWVPYEQLNTESYVYCVEVEKYVPRLEFKVKLEGASKRSNRYTAGFNKDINANSSSEQQSCGDAFRGNSGSFTGEIGLDCSSFWEDFEKNNGSGKFFLETSGSGTVSELSLMIYDHTGNNLIKEIECDETNVSIGSTMSIAVEDVTDIKSSVPNVAQKLIKIRKCSGVYAIYLPFNGKYKITVMDLKGRQLAYFNTNSKGWHNIPASLQSGVHIVTIGNGNKNYVEKLNCMQ